MRAFWDCFVRLVKVPLSRLVLFRIVSYRKVIFVS
jgi:hypothetical protein